MSSTSEALETPFEKESVMRPIGSIILSCLLAVLAVVPQRSAAEVDALRIRDKAFDSQTGELRYELWNESTKTISAWRLSLAYGDLHGHGRRSLLDQDYFDRLPSPGVDTAAGPIAPGASLEARWLLDLGGADIGATALSLTVRTVIFEDLSWQGEAEAAAVILDARAARVQEIGRVLDALEQQMRRTASRHEWPAVLRRQAQELERRGRDPESSTGERRETAAVVSATRIELARWLEDGSRELALSPDPDEALQHLTRSLRSRYESGLRAVLTEGSVGDEAAVPEGGDR